MYLYFIYLDVGRSTGAIRHATNTPRTRTGLTSMYIYGGSILSLLSLVVGLIGSGSLSAAVEVVINFYISRLVPWPVDQLLLAETWFELIVSHGVTVGVGQLVASTKWWASQ